MNTGDDGREWSVIKFVNKEFMDQYGKFQRGDRQIINFLLFITTIIILTILLLL